MSIVGFSGDVEWRSWGLALYRYDRSPFKLGGFGEGLDEYLQYTISFSWRGAKLRFMTAHTIG